MYASAIRIIPFNFATAAGTFESGTMPSLPILWYSSSIVWIVVCAAARLVKNPS